MTHARHGRMPWLIGGIILAALAVVAIIIHRVADGDSPAGTEAPVLLKFFPPVFALVGLACLISIFYTATSRRTRKASDARDDEEADPISDAMRANLSTSTQPPTGAPGLDDGKRQCAAEFCPFCGEQVSAPFNHCPKCGKDF